MFIKNRTAVAVLGGLIVIFLSVSLLCAKEPDEIKITTEKLAENLYLLQDSEGMGITTVLTGYDGVLMVDSKVEKSIDRLLEKIKELSGQPIRFLINTHWHIDHVGGNEKVVETGATIIAHENLRKRMGIEHDIKVLNMKVPPSPEKTRPLITFKKEITFHLNGEVVKVFHIEPGHTDGDAVVHFQNANVIQMGDLYFEGIYPYICIYSGGSINGMIKVIRQVLSGMNDQTKVVPGHGPLTDKARLQEYVSMLSAIRDNVSRLMQEGKTLEEVIAAKPTRAFDEKWGKGFLSPDQFARLVYMDLSPKLP